MQSFEEHVTTLYETAQLNALREIRVKRVTLKSLQYLETTLKLSNCLVTIFNF